MEQIDSSRQVPCWGLYPWFPEHGEQMIHPNDVSIVIALSPYIRVFELVDVDEDYLVLSYGDCTFRVRPNLFHEVEQPIKRIGDIVQVESKGEIVTGLIVEVQWHYKKNKPFYFITKNGKQVSKRYWEIDFL